MGSKHSRAPKPPPAQPSLHSHHLRPYPQLVFVSHSPTWNEVLLFGWGEKQMQQNIESARSAPFPMEGTPGMQLGLCMELPLPSPPLCVEGLIPEHTCPQVSAEQHP